MTSTESILIGAAFNEPTITLTLDVSPQDFGGEVNARLWSLLTDAANSGSRLSVNQIQTAWPEIVDYVKAIAALGCPSSVELSQYAKALRDESARRRLQQIAEQISFDAGNLELTPEEIAAQAVGSLSAAMQPTAKSKRKVAEQVVEDQSKPARIYPTGLLRFDESLGGGFYAGKLYALAARKKVGKSAFLGTVSHNLNGAGVKHLFIALEMSPVEIEHRNMARELGFNSIKFLRRSLNGELKRAAEYAVNVPDFTLYEHRPGASLDEIRKMVSRAVLHDGISGVILDYWQLVGGKAKSDTEELHLRTVAQWLADFCRRENIWAFVAAQLNQEGNSRGGEGIKLACDMYLTMHREKNSDGAWIEMEESRYVPYQHIGTESDPGFIFNKHGPFFEETPPIAATVRTYHDS